MKKTICFGEMLWDMLPSGKMPGGAPMNVAIHLKNFENDSTIISRVGHDDLGKKLGEFVAGHGLETHFIQQGETHLTGVVKVNMDDKNNVSYKIVKPVAWDYIQFEEQAAEAIRQADCFIFGSLSARSERTFETLKSYLAIAPLKIFDINLRPPHFEKKSIEYLFNQTDILKMNHHELEIISEWFLSSSDTQERLEQLSNLFQIPTICITMGEDGAMVFHHGKIYQSAGFTIKVADSIGSGDAFLASFISDFLNQIPLNEAIRNACVVGALVAERHGATPKISKQDIQSLLDKSLKYEYSN